MNSFRNGFLHFGLIIKVDAKLLFSDHICFAIERIHQHQFVICDAESLQVVPGFSVVVAIADDDNVAVPDVYKLPEESVGIIEQSIEAEVHCCGAFLHHFSSRLSVEVPATGPRALTCPVHVGHC